MSATGPLGLNLVFFEMRVTVRRMLELSSFLTSIHFDARLSDYNRPLKFFTGVVEMLKYLKIYIHKGLRLCKK